MGQKDCRPIIRVELKSMPIDLAAQRKMTELLSSPTGPAPFQGAEERRERSEAQLLPAVNTRLLGSRLKSTTDAF